MLNKIFRQPATSWLLLDKCLEMITQTAEPALLRELGELALKATIFLVIVNIMITGATGCVTD